MNNSTRAEVIYHTRTLNNEVCIAVKTKNFVKSAKIRDLNTRINDLTGLKGIVSLLDQTNPQSKVYMVYLDYCQMDKPARDIVAAVKEAMDATFNNAPHEIFLFNSLVDKTFTYSSLSDIEDQEDAKLVEEALKEHKESGGETVSLEELMEDIENETTNTVSD